MGHIGIPLGIIIGLFASFVQSLGMTIQRKSHILNGQLPESEQRVGYRRPLWLLGFGVFLSSNVIGSVVQIASLPVVILAPLGAVSLLWNAFFAKFLLGDVFSAWMILGTLFIAGGAVLIAIFGIVPEPTRSIEDLLMLFNRSAFIVYFTLLGIAVFVCLIATHFAEYRLSKRLVAVTAASSPSFTLPHSSEPAQNDCERIDAVENTERTALLDSKYSSSPSISLGVAAAKAAESTRLWIAVSYASVSGIISGMCLLFAKSGVELLLLTWQGNNQFWRWQSWMLVLGLIAFAFLQLWYMHKALVLADPTLVCPSAFCFYNLSSIVNGLIYYDQLELIAPVHLMLVAVGIVILLAGVWIVSIQAGKGVVEVATEWEEEVMDAIEDPLPPSLAAAMEQQTTSTSAPTRHPSSPTLRPRARMVSEPLLSSLGHHRDFSSGSILEPQSHSLESHSLESSLTLSPTRSPRRRRTMAAIDMPDSVDSLSPLNAIPSLGSGFSIGLSPISPGFSLVPRVRAAKSRLAGMGWSQRSGLPASVEQALRRVVSEGDLPSNEDAGTFVAPTIEVDPSIRNSMFTFHSLWPRLRSLFSPG